MSSKRGDGHGALDPGGEAMAHNLAPDHSLVGAPVELHDAALADEGSVPVIGYVATPEGDQRTPFWQHLDDNVVEIVGGPQKPEPAASVPPIGIKVDQHRDDLGLAIRMDFAIPRGATPAHCGHRGPTIEIDVELHLEGAAHLGGVEFLHQPREGLPIV